MTKTKYRIKTTSALASCALLCGGSLATAETLDFTPQSGVEGLSIKWDSADQARANQSFAYTLTVSNTNEAPLNDVQIFQLLPDNFQVDSSEPLHMKPMNEADSSMDRRESYRDAAEMRDGKVEKPAADKKAGSGKNTLNWTLGMLKPGESRTIKVHGLPSAEGQIETCLWATSQPVICRTIEVVKPDLQIVQSVMDSNGNARNVFYACETVTLNYVVTNPGSGDLKDVNAMVDLPEGFRLAGDKASKIEVGTLTGGQSKDFKMNLEPIKTGTFAVSGKAMSDKLNAESNRASIEIVKPTLEVEVEAPNETYFGREVTYRVTVSNTSDFPALDTVVDFPLDAANRRFTNTGQEIAENVQTFTLGTIDGGESESFTVTFDPTAPGTFETKATAKAYCADAVDTNVKTIVSGIPALQIYVVDQQDPVKVGEETYYELQIINEGTAEDLKINLEGVLPDSLTFVSADGDSKITADGQTLKFDSLKTLAPGETVSWNIKVKGKKPGRGVFKVDLNSENRKGLRSSEPTTVF